MEIHLILLGMIFAAVVAVEMSDLISSVIALSAVGLGLSLAFLVLKAPNLAITQLVVEILCVMILIRSTINRDIPFVKSGRWLFNTVVTLLFISAFLMISYFALKELPRFGEPLMRVASIYIRDGQALTREDNLVSAIALVFRRYDVLVETAVIFAAVIGALAIARPKGKTDGK